jgi:hypothetical protein
MSYHSVRVAQGTIFGYHWLQPKVSSGEIRMIMTAGDLAGQAMLCGHAQEARQL